MDPRDEDLMRDVQAGRWESFDILVGRYRVPLLRLSASKLDDAAAEDVVQETFLAVFAARQTYRPEYAFRTWLWTIALNLCKRQARKAAREPSLLFDAPVVREAPASTSIQQLIETERQTALRAALAQLPEPQADALRLRFFGGLKFDEIAAAMGSSVSGAKLRVKQGLIKLAELLPPHEDRAS